VKLIDADALREEINSHGPYERADQPDWETVKSVLVAIDAAPFINCAADNPHGLIPSRCPMCGEGLVPAPCMDLAQDSYRAGILYGQEHPEWQANQRGTK